MTDTDTTNPDLTGLEGLSSEEITELYTLLAQDPEVTTAPTAPALFSSALFNDFVSEKQAQGFKNLVEGSGLTEQQVATRYPDVKTGPALFSRLSKDIEAARRDVMAGERRSGAQRGHLESCVVNLRASGLPGARGLAESIDKKVLYAVGVDRLAYSDAIEDAHDAMESMRIVIPERQDKDSAQVDTPDDNTLEGSVVTGADPAEEPF